MKRTMAVLFAVVLLSGLLTVSAGATQNFYKPITFSNVYATLTIDKARMNDEGKEGEYTIYGVPNGAQLTVTVTGKQKDLDLYIGAMFMSLSGGDINTGGNSLGTAEYVLRGEHALQRVYLTDENNNILEENKDWISSADSIRQNGTYHFTLSATDYIGWIFTPLCGTKIAGGHFPETSTSDFHGFINGNFHDENEGLISFTVEKGELESDTIFADVPANSYCYDAVRWALNNNITTGKTARTFAPNETCTIGQFMTFLWRASGSIEPTITSPFTDVRDDRYYYKAALWSSEHGLVSGNKFNADTPCTRAMAMMYLWILSGAPSVNETLPYTDIVAHAPYAQAIAWAVNIGITKGKTDSTFAPDDTCTRGQIVTFFYRGFEK